MNKEVLFVVKVALSSCLIRIVMKLVKPVIASFSCAPNFKASLFSTIGSIGSRVEALSSSLIVSMDKLSNIGHWKREMYVIKIDEKWMCFLKKKIKRLFF